VVDDFNPVPEFSPEGTLRDEDMLLPFPDEDVAILVDPSSTLPPWMFCTSADYPFISLCE
jgi:hypothetical protein